MATQTPTARTATRLTLVATVLAALTLSLIAFAGPVLGSSVTGVDVSPSTNDCDDFSATSELELKQKDNTAAPTHYTGVWGDLTADYNGDDNAGTALDAFSSTTHYVIAVIIQGSGNNAGTQVWDYGTGVASDTNLDPASDGHIVQTLFCFGDAIPAGPGGSVGNDALPMLGGVSPIPTVVFTGLLLASLGALAYANVKTARNRS